MPLFLRNLFLFLLPLLLLFIPSFWLLFSAGEFYTLEQVGEMARGTKPILVGDAYSDYRAAYQLQEVLARRPKVVALGSSRVGQFNSQFFNDLHVFYNATGAGAALSNFTYFVSSVSDHPPQIIIAGMDQYFFNPENAKNSVVTRPNPFQTNITWYDPFFESYFRQGGWWKVYSDYVSNKFSLENVFESTSPEPVLIGLRSHALVTGFKNDGSNYSADILKKEQKQKIKKGIDALARTVTDTLGDEYGSDISPQALTELRKFLSEARQKNITVVGFLPPISHVVYSKLAAHPNAPYAKAFKTLGVTLSSVYKEYGFELYDFTDLSSFESSDAEMVESKHGSEKTYARMILQMAKVGSALSPYVDAQKISNAIASSTNPYEIFPYK